MKQLTPLLKKRPAKYVSETSKLELIERAPEFALVMAVLERAFLDASGHTGSTPNSSNSVQQKEELIRESRQWFDEPRFGLGYWCSLLNLDTENVKRMARERYKIST